MDNYRNQGLFFALIESGRDNYRILTQIREIGISSFNGLEVNFRNLYNDLNMIRKVIVNNQGIVTKQNMVQINFLAEMDERIQKGFRMIDIRITRGFENELTMMQIQIISQIRQKIELMNIGMQKFRKEMNNSLDTELKRIFSELTDHQETSLSNMFENVRNLFILYEEKSGKEHESIRSLLDQDIGYLDSRIKDEFVKADKLNDVKLSAIDNNKHVVYKEMSNLIRISESKFQEISNEISIFSDNNNGNFGNVFEWFKAQDEQN
jgi:hypothetical protein